MLTETNDWPQVVAAHFERDGLLEKSGGGFVVRSQQVQMARAIAGVVHDGGMLAVEAGTGVGKTFAYLLPVILSGRKCLISTATRNLQDQLFSRDLPRLLKLLGVPLEVALLKGRSSYLCSYRLELAQSQVLPVHARRGVEQIIRWAPGTQSGDLSEVGGLDERAPWLPLVTSTRENCLGSDCPNARGCHVNLARRKAQQADLVVINHHLFFADLRIRDGAQTRLLPDWEVVVFDEAHQLQETGLQFLGDQAGSGPLLDLVRDVLGAGLQHARGLAPWQDLCGRLERAVRDWRLIFPSAGAGARLAWEGTAPAGVSENGWRDAMSDLDAALIALQQALTTCEELSADMARLTERAIELRGGLHLFAVECPVDTVRWVELGRGLRLNQTPLEIGPWMQTHVWQACVEHGKALIFTSATLAEDADLKWFRQGLGLDHAQGLQLGSPYDFAAQAALCVPRDFPLPSESGHGQAVARLAARCATALGGRTLVLTTSLRALQEIATVLQQELPQDFELLVQGQASRQELVERFGRTQSSHGGRPACKVLVGSVSFWEGVDIPGHALMAVLIDKLPFPVPSDPWVQARSRQLARQGNNAFAHYSLPAAIVALKQGAGRLIRSEHDCGILFVCDRRLLSAGYGRRVLGALPPMRRLSSDSAVEAELELLAEVLSREMP